MKWESDNLLYVTEAFAFSGDGINGSKEGWYVLSIRLESEIYKIIHKNEKHWDNNCFLNDVSHT